jgi:hypothetical protein
MGRSRRGATVVTRATFLAAVAVAAVALTQPLGAAPAPSTRWGERPAAVATATCTAAEKARRKRALAAFVRTMAARRRDFFRTHKSRRARRAFVRGQQAKVRALRRAAACKVVPPGARIVARISIPNDGGVGAGDGYVWVLDRVAARLDKVDPATNTVAARFDGIGDAAPVVGEGAVWVPSIYSNTLFRVDLVTGAVTRIATGPSEDEWPITAVVTPGAVWVGNHHGGTVARIDPTTEAVVASVPWGEHANGGISHMATVGSSIWVTGSRTADVAEIDPATNSVVRRTPVPTGTCGGIAVDAAAVWVTSGFDRPYACWQRARWGVSRIDRATGAVSRIDVGGRPIDVALAFGSVWVVVDAPTLELVRLNPATHRVIGGLALAPGRCAPDRTGNCPGAEYATALSVGFGSLWLRRAVASNLGGTQPPGVLLRIVPR